MIFNYPDGGQDIVEWQECFSVALFARCNLAFILPNCKAVRESKKGAALDSIILY